MSDVKWIKLATDIFDNRKIRQIECLPEGYAIIVMWVKLLCLAGNINDSGLVYFTKEIPYTDQMIATQFNIPLTTVQMALKVFQQFGMIEVIDNVMHISNWEKYQSVDRLAEIREYNRIAKQKSREKQKLLQAVNDMSMTSQPCQGTDIDKEEDKEGDLELDTKEIHKEKADCQLIADLYNSVCISLPSVKSLSEARKKAIRARLNSYTVDDFKTVFQNAEASAFLKGGNDRNWTATFDWLIKDTNFAKVLDGNYKNKPNRNGKRSEPVPEWMQREQADKEIEEMRRLQERLNTAGNNPDVAARAEALKQSLMKGGSRT